MIEHFFLDIFEGHLELNVSFLRLKKKNSAMRSHISFLSSSSLLVNIHIFQTYINQHIFHFISIKRLFSYYSILFNFAIWKYYIKIHIFYKLIMNLKSS